MALPTVAAVSTSLSEDSGASIIVALPAHQADDILLVVLEHRPTEDVSTATPGWVAVTDSPVHSSTDANAGTILSCYWKRAADGAETEPTFTGFDANHCFGAAIVIRGCVASGNPWDVTASSLASSGTTVVSIPGDTTTVNDCLIVLLCTHAGDISTAAFSGETNADLANLTERFDASDASGNGGGIGIWTGEKATAGAFGATAATLSGSYEQARLTIALKPSGTGSSGTVTVPLTTWEVDVFAPTVSGGSGGSGGAAVEIDTTWDPRGRHKLSLWDNYACAGGSRLAVIAEEDVADGWARFTLDNRHELQFSAYEDAPWISQATVRTVIRLDDVLGRTSEWKIDRIEDEVGGDPIVHFICVPVFMEMRAAGLIASRVDAGDTFFNQGGVTTLPHQYIDTYVVPTLEFYGISWVSRGTIEFTEPIDLSWDLWTPLELMQAIAKAAGAEWRLRRDGESGYKIDLLEEIGSDEPTVLITPKRNLVRLRRSRNAGPMATVITPVGGSVVGGTGERHSVGRAAWEVTAVSSNDVTLADPAGGDGPVAFADQLNDLYLLKPDGTLTQISDSTTSHVVTVDDATGVSVGDHVEIRADSDGALLVELANPVNALDPPDGYGRITGALARDDLRGERNHVINPFFDDWTTKPDGAEGLVNGATVSSSSVALDGLTVGLVIVAGDILWRPFASGGQQANAFHEVATGGTVNGSGEVSLVLSNAESFADNQRVVVFRQTGKQPADWVHRTSSTRQVPMMYRTRGGLSMAGAVNGAHVADPTLALDGLTASTDLFYGDLIVIGSNRYVVLLPTTTNGSGAVTVSVFPAATEANDAVATISRPAISDGFRGDQVLMIPMPAALAAAGEPVVETEHFTIPFHEGMPAVWVTVGLSMLSLNTTGGTAASLTFGSSAGQIEPPKIELFNASNTLLASVAYGTGTLTASTLLNATLSVEHEFTADTEVYVRITGILGDNFSGTPINNKPDVYTMVRFVSVMATADENCPPVVGSHANKLWQAANKELVKRSSPVSTYEPIVLDVAALLGFTASVEELALGGTLRLKASDDINAELRIVDMRLNLKEVHDARLVLDTTREFISKRIPPPTRPLYVSAVIDGVKQALVATERPASDVEGAQRIVGGFSSGGEVPASPDILIPKPFVPWGLAPAS